MSNLFGKVVCVYIVILLIVERIILHFQEKSKSYIESDDVWDKIENFFFRLFCSALIIQAFLILSKIYIDFFM